MVGEAQTNLSSSLSPSSSSPSSSSTASSSPFNLIISVLLSWIQFIVEKNKIIIAKIKRSIVKMQITARWGIINVMAQGPIPRHVAFIMDGNRRFARKAHQATIQGHFAGFKALEQILSWSLDLGISVVTVYAFSIENFKRPAQEVQDLMALAAEKFDAMMQENKMIDNLGIRVCVQGDLSLIPEHTRDAINRVVEYSKNNTKATLNVCFAYTSRDEMTRAVRTLVDSAERANHSLSSLSPFSPLSLDDDASRIMKLVKGGLDAVVSPPTGEEGAERWGENGETEEERGNISKTREKEEREREWNDGREGQWGWEDELWRAMQISSAPDLLVRTSGEVRFSDFLLWQTAFSCVVFLQVLWPDFSLWHFLYVMLVYQSNFKTMQARRKDYTDNIKNKLLQKEDIIDDTLTEEDEDVS